MHRHDAEMARLSAEVKRLRKTVDAQNAAIALLARVALWLLYSRLSAAQRMLFDGWKDPRWEANHDSTV